MLIFLTGGSGFVGRALSRELVSRGHHVRCLLRPGSKHPLIESPLVKPVCGNLFSPRQLVPLIKGADAVIHLVGIIRQFPSQQITFEHLHRDATASIIKASEEAGIRRYLHMSANGTGAKALSRYHQTKWQAEEIVRSSKLDWTIFRPSLIYGTEDHFINMIAGLIKKLPLFPILGDGEFRMQPVPVQQIASGFSAALERNISIGKTYHCGGEECLSYNQLVDLVGAVLGKKRVLKICQPLFLMRPLVALLQHLPLFPLTSDQLQMMIAGNCCDPTEWLTDLGLESRTFFNGLDYLKS